MRAASARRASSFPAPGARSLHGEQICGGCYSLRWAVLTAQRNRAEDEEATEEHEAGRVIRLAEHDGGDADHGGGGS